MTQLAKNTGDTILIARMILGNTQVQNHILKPLDLVGLVLPLSLDYFGPEETLFDQEKRTSIPTGVCPIILGSDSKDCTYLVRIGDFFVAYTGQRARNTASDPFFNLLKQSRSKYVYIAQEYCEFVPAPLQLGETYNIPRV